MATMGERIVERLGGVTKSSLEQETNRAYEAGFYAGMEDESASGDIAQYGYRAIGGGRRDNPKRKDVLNSLWQIWNSSDMAEWLLTTKRDHILGHQATPTTDDKQLKEVLDCFWRDNKMGRRAGEFAVQLEFFGEQCYPVFVRKSDGAVSLGYIDPENIDDVIHDPNNALDPYAVVVNFNGDPNNQRVYRIIRPDNGAFVDGKLSPPKHEGRLITHLQAELSSWEVECLKTKNKTDYDGSCIFEKVGAFSNQTRGVPKLQRTADWLDQIDEVLFSLADREQEAGYFSWDVEMTGVDDTKIRQRQKELQNNPPKRGSVRVHGDSERWELKTPDIKQYGSIASFRALLGFTLGGRGFPVHWYGFGDDANRATSESQSTPTHKRMEYDQAILKDMFILMLTFARDQAFIAGKLDGESANATMDLPLPEISKKTLMELIPQLTPLISSLIMAVEDGFMSREKAVEVWAKVLSKAGIEIDALEEMDEEGVEDVKKANDILKAKLGANGTG